MQKGFRALGALESRAATATATQLQELPCSKPTLCTSVIFQDPESRRNDQKHPERSIGSRSTSASHPGNPLYLQLSSNYPYLVGLTNQKNRMGNEGPQAQRKALGQPRHTATLRSTRSTWLPRTTGRCQGDNRTCPATCQDGLLYPIIP